MSVNIFVKRLHIIIIFFFKSHDPSSGLVALATANMALNESKYINGSSI